MPNNNNMHIIRSEISIVNIGRRKVVWRRISALLRKMQVQLSTYTLELKGIAEVGTKSIRRN